MYQTPNLTEEKTSKVKPNLQGLNTSVSNMERHQQSHGEESVGSPLSQGQESWDASSVSTISSPTSSSSTSLPEPLHHYPEIEEEKENITTAPPPSVVDPIPFVPAPWLLDLRVQGPLHAKGLCLLPLEAQSSFATSEASKPVGGLGMVQILRYKDSPVGPYDELLVVPGNFDWTREDPSGKKKTGRNPKISRIYVSQKHTCYNGRLNWNVPKHLARFDWQDSPDGSTTVKVFPHDMSGDLNESQASSVPFFQGTFKPMRYAPRFPFATRWVNYLGFDSTLVMPPLPAGSGSQGELPGTGRRWCSLVPQQYCRRTALGWFDIAQRDEYGRVTGSYENFWPGLGRWQVGMKMEDAELSFEEPVETWEEVVALHGRSQRPRARL
ncbi:hypothetical protein PT974_10513 [Cladobotryum mycophilum]|uniref:Uncharacterized protein n=1 Tax=Cladobotryum mycophilum TaxID=491253 RepID=A0ABR0SB49_9HYPO